MRSDPGRAARSLAMALALSATACAGSAEVTPTVDQPQADYSLEQQAVGRPAAGLTLRSIRHASHPGFYRLVFDIGQQHGSVAREAPAAQAAYRVRDQSIELLLSGVADDLTGNLPLTTEQGEALGKPVRIQRGPVAWLARELALSDMVAYQIHLTRRARFRLLAIDAPGRIVLDIEDVRAVR